MSGSSGLSSFLTVRLSPIERMRLDSNASALDVSKSAYIRALVSLPIRVVDQSSAFDEGDPSNTFVVFDKRTFKDLHKQLRAWGYHYNQAVHSLNIVSSKKMLPVEESFQYVTKAVDLLEDIDDYRETIDNCIRRLETLEMVKVGR